MAAGNSRIARNTTYLTIASVLQKIISFGYYAFLAVSIGTANLGKYDFALKFTSVFIIFMDFGLGPLLTREAAKDEEHVETHFQRIFSIKLVLIAVSLIALFVTIHIWDYAFENITRSDVVLVYISALIIVVDTITFTLYSVFRALKQLQWEAIGIVLYQASILGAGIAVLRAGLPLFAVLIALLIGSGIQCIYILWLVHTKTHLRFRFVWDNAFVRKTLAIAAPFALAGVVYRLNGSADSIMLKIMSDDNDVGWYGLAFKLSFALTVLPGAFATSYFPVVSMLYKEAKEKLHSIFESGMFYMLILGIPIAAGVLVLGDNIILGPWLGPDWSTSIQPLWILMLGLPFVFVNYPIGNFLNAVDKQKINMVNMIIALLVNIGLNAVLIPLYTFNGAAIASTVSIVVLVLLGLPWVFREAPFRVGFILKKALAALFSAAFMAFVLFFIQYSYPLLLLIPLGIVLYFGSMLLITGITTEELRGVRTAILKR